MQVATPRLRGWHRFFRDMARSYALSCQTWRSGTDHKEYWYREDGTSTGVAADGKSLPADAAYATTEDHGEACAHSGNPSICALILDSNVGCAGPWCKCSDDVVGEIDAADEVEAVDASGASRDSEPMTGADLRAQVCTIDPPQDMTIDGTHYWVLDKDFTFQRADGFIDWVAATRVDLLAAAQDAAKGLAAASRAQASPADDPGFQSMCIEAGTYFNQCAQRQSTMGQVGTVSGSFSDSSGPLMGMQNQAGFFGECAMLYGSVLDLCRANGVPVTVVPSTEATASSAPLVSGSCEAMARDYAAAAAANDGARAYAGLEALRQSCPEVLDAIANRTRMAYPVTSAFPTRSSGTLSTDLFGGCLESSDTCSGEAAALQSASDGNAEAALFSQSITFGLALGGLIGSGIQLQQALSVPEASQTDMTSLTPGAVAVGNTASTPDMSNWNNNSTISGPSGGTASGDTSPSAPAY